MPHARIPVAILAAAAAIAAGCGGDARPRPGAPTAQDQMTRFVECLRDQGLDVPDPTTAGGDTAIELDGGASPQEARRAHEACKHAMPRLGDATGDPARAAELQDKAVRFAECMRDRGVDIPDPRSTGGAVTFTPGRPGQGPDEGDPAVRRAYEQCRRHLPEAPGR